MVCGSYREIRKRKSSKPQKLKTAVIFDLDNTLIDTYGVYRNAKSELTKKIRKSNGKVGDENKLIDRIFCQKFNTCNYDQRELVAEACRVTHCSRCDIQMLTIQYEAELNKVPQLFEKTKDVLLTLKKRGTNIVLLSEGTKDQKQIILKAHGLEKIFDFIWFVEHKEQKHFKAVMKTLQEQGYKYIYCVGDSIKKDIRLGNSVGAQTIWIPSKWEVGKPDVPANCPKYKISKIEEILAIIK
ncbi:MAG: HAD family hydrolase [Candidatus Bathyarchaeia archaeon]